LTFDEHVFAKDEHARYGFFVYLATEPTKKQINRPTIVQLQERALLAITRPLVPIL
jgi:hypothetical protein